MADQTSQTASAHRIGLYFTACNRLNYLIAKTLALGGCQVFVRSEVPLAELMVGPGELGTAEREYCSWLYSESDIKIVGDSESYPEVDALLYEIRHARPKIPANLHAWMKRARRIAAWNSNLHESTRWQNLRGDLVSAIRFADFLPATRNVIMMGGRTFLRPTALLARASRQGYFTHPKFLREPALRTEMFSTGWDAETTRPIRLNFSGNPEPASRRRMIEDIGNFLRNRADVRFFDDYEGIPNRSASITEQSVLWMVRAEAHDPNWHLRRDVVPPIRWPGVLRLSDFSICPPGYERKTHRVVESLLQGVVPILDCPKEYSLGLRDGFNCLVVRNGRWNDVLTSALEMTQSEVIRLRKAVCAMARVELHPTGTANRLLKQMGVAE